MKTILQIIALLLLIMSAACGPTANAIAGDVPSGPGAWIDAPLDNSSLPQAEYQVVSHASDPGGVSLFELKVNGQVVSTDPVEGGQAGDTIAHISQPWLPPAPGTYLLEVRAKNNAGAFGPPASARVTVGGGQTATLTPELAATETPGQPAGCQVEAVVNLFCRAGPGSVYKDLDSMIPGQMAPIIGQSLDGQYWYVKGPNLGVTCTVPTGPAFVIVHGENCVVPRFTPPPTPRPTEAPERHPQCDDGIDNDGDGRTDYNAAGVGDRECTSATDNDEAHR